MDSPHPKSPDEAFEEWWEQDAGIHPAIRDLHKPDYKYVFKAGYNYNKKGEEEKMRCVACDERLTGREATRKFLYSGKYTDMCSKCLETIRDMAPTEDDDVRQAPPDEQEDSQLSEGEDFEESNRFEA